MEALGLRSVSSQFVFLIGRSKRTRPRIRPSESHFVGNALFTKIERSEFENRWGLSGENKDLAGQKLDKDPRAAVRNDDNSKNSIMTKPDLSRMEIIRSYKPHVVGHVDADFDRPGGRGRLEPIESSSLLFAITVFSRLRSQSSTIACRS